MHVQSQHGHYKGKIVRLSSYIYIYDTFAKLKFVYESIFEIYVFYRIVGIRQVLVI